MRKAENRPRPAIAGLMRKLALAMISGLAVWLAACESGQASGDTGRLEGNWVWPERMAYRMEDSLLRDSLRTYFGERGIDLDQYFDVLNPNRDSVSRAVFDSLLKAFRFSCPAPVPVCSETLWIEERWLGIDADSMHYRWYRDSVRTRIRSLVFSEDFGYSMQGRYLIRQFAPDISDSLDFEIRNGDTLFLGPDTLVRSTRRPGSPHPQARPGPAAGA